MKAFVKLALGLIAVLALALLGLPAGAASAKAQLADPWGPYKSVTVSGGHGELKGTNTVSGDNLQVAYTLSDQTNDTTRCVLALFRYSLGGGATVNAPHPYCGPTSAAATFNSAGTLNDADFLDVRVCMSKSASTSTPIAGSCSAWKDIYEKEATVFEDDFGPFYSGKYKSSRNYTKGHVEVQDGDLELDGRLYDKIKKYCAIAYVKVTTTSADEQEFTHCGGGYGAIEVEESGVKAVDIKVCAYDEGKDKAFKCSKWKSVYVD